MEDSGAGARQHPSVTQRIGLLVNPIAGIGGRVGLKGSDGVVELALSRGATPRAGLRPLETLRAQPEVAPAPGDGNKKGFFRRVRDAFAS